MRNLLDLNQFLVFLELEPGTGTWKKTPNVLSARDCDYLSHPKKNSTELNICRLRMTYLYVLIDLHLSVYLTAFPLYSAIVKPCPN